MSGYTPALLWLVDSPVRIIDVRRENPLFMHKQIHVYIHIMYIVLFREDTKGPYIQRDYELVLHCPPSKGVKPT